MTTADDHWPATLARVTELGVPVNCGSIDMLEQDIPGVLAIAEALAAYIGSRWPQDQIREEAARGR